jgi:hypothetical protein
MGLFDSAATKQLKKDAGFIGQLVAGQALGELPPGAAQEMIESETQREQLRAALDAADAELGHEKALKKAVKEAGSMARIHLEVRKQRVGDVPRAAENAILAMVD